MGVLSSELRGWIVPGRAGVIAIVDASGLPRIARIWAARPLEGNDVIEVCVQRSGARPVLEAVESSARVRAALNLIEVATYRSRTFKGSCELSPSGADVAIVDASVVAMGHAFQSVGMAADLVDRILSHGDGDGPRAMVALRLAVDSVFDQSPKPGAGARL